MKSTRLRLLTAFVLVGAVLVAIVSALWGDRGAPRFVPGAPAIASPFTSVYFSSRDDAPFAGGKVWLQATSGTNTHQYLFDLDRKVILGELFNADGPEFCNQDGSRLLVAGQDVQPGSFKQKTMDTINATTRRVFGKEMFPPKYTKAVWVLNLTNNTAVHLGEVLCHPRVHDAWHPSPDFRRAYTAPGRSFYLCGLEAESLKEISIGGEVEVVGWWDDHRLLVNNGTNQFDLFDVVTRTTTNLFSPSDIAAFLMSEGLGNAPFGLEARPSWNGHDYDFYFTRDLIRYGNTFLLKASRADPTLKLLYRNFKPQFFGCFDSASTRYVYPGTTFSGDHGAVYLRQLTNDVTITLVPPDSQRNYWSGFPCFYGNEVIYSRGALVRRMDLSGSNDVVLLPGSGP